MIFISTFTSGMTYVENDNLIAYKEGFLANLIEKKQDTLQKNYNTVYSTMKGKRTIAYPSLFFLSLSIITYLICQAFHKQNYWR